MARLRDSTLVVIGDAWGKLVKDLLFWNTLFVFDDGQLLNISMYWYLHAARPQAVMICNSTE
jgi:hypothetical protein